jgi:diguanylate cyclase (GGDEF)-like protein
VTVALAALALLVVASGAVLWWSATEGLAGVERTRQVDSRVAQAAQDIRYLDELLTHSAARYAATGDPRWRERYDDGVVRLDAAIALSRELSGPDATRPLDAVDDANQRLIALETRIFELGGEGRLAAAQDLLIGEYEVEKARYGRGLATFVAQQEAAADAALESRRATLAANRAVTAALVLVLLASVAGLWRVYRSRAALLRDQADRLADQATTDSLTGLPNRRAATGLLSELTTAVARGDRGAVMFIDLDGFKAVNDTFGHAAGDRVLDEAARRLSEVVAGTAGTDGHVARLGGDEFLVVLRRDLDEARRLAQRCLERLEEPFAVGSATSRLSASIGIVAAGADGPDALLQDADFAAAYAKDHGKSQVQEFVPAMRQRMIDRHRVEGELRAALAAGRLEVHYQPFVEMAAGSSAPGPGHRVVGAEALVRWRLADGSLVLPGDFIPIAEGSWLIVEIDKLVLDAACAQLAEWAAAGLDLTVAVRPPRHPRGPGRRRPGRPDGSRRGAVPPHRRAHRDRGGQRRRPGGGRPRRGPCPRGQGGTRRLHHRVLDADAPHDAAGRHHQDRPQLRQRHRLRPGAPARRVPAAAGGAQRGGRRRRRGRDGAAARRPRVPHRSGLPVHPGAGAGQVPRLGTGARRRVRDARPRPASPRGLAPRRRRHRLTRGITSREASTSWSTCPAGSSPKGTRTRASAPASARSRSRPATSAGLGPVAVQPSPATSGAGGATAGSPHQ